MVLRTFGWSFAVTAAALVGSFILGGWKAFLLVLILSILEISLSFDNAVVNATILVRMNAFWQKLFLTVGILIAVFGMRLIFPLLLVGITAKLGPIEVIEKALEGGPVEQEGTYAHYLHEAHPSIAAFGGMFLLMLFLDFIFEDREITWLTWLERPLARIGKLDQLAVIVALVALTVAAETLAEEPGTVMVAGVLGAVTYIAVNGLGELFEEAGHIGDEHADDEPGGEGISGAAVDRQPGTTAAPPEGKVAVASDGNEVRGVGKAAGKAAFFLFLYLEVLDASFSFDGVIGAFAITQDIFIIAVGLGVGAMYIRSLTVYLVRQGTLEDYVYLEHGAHWAIGALAAILLVSIKYEVPEIITGLIGVGFILAAFISSLARNRRVHAEEAAARPAEQPAGR